MEADSAQGLAPGWCGHAKSMEEKKLKSFQPKCLEDVP